MEPPQPTFNITDYFEKMDANIRAIMQRPEKDNLTYDILDTENTRKHKLIAHLERLRVMKQGEIWQTMIGNFHTFTDLKVGHPTGLDILSEERKIAMELKNRTNTDNHSAKKSNMNKLAKFKRENPEYTCVYANINDSTEAKTMNSQPKTIVWEGAEIQVLTGTSLLRFIFGENVDAVIEFTRNTIDKYYSG